MLIVDEPRKFSPSNVSTYTVYVRALCVCVIYQNVLLPITPNIIFISYGKSLCEVFELSNQALY